MASLLAALAWAALGARAQELGTPVRFGAEYAVTASPSGRRPAETGPSEPLEGDWDVALWQGRSGHPELRYWISRELPDGRWGEWVPAQTRMFRGGRFWARAQLPGGGRRLRLRVSAPGSPGRADVEIYSVEVFPQGAEGEKGSPSPAAPPGPPRPPVFTRVQWGAKPAREAYEPNLPTMIAIHHTAGAQPTTAAESIQELQFIQDFHQNGRGWIDIGYHYLIDPAGRVFEGRPETAIGAHALNHNVGSLGVAFLGTYHPPQSHPVAPEALAAFVSLARYLATTYKIDPRDVYGHRDVRATSCPGDALYALIPELRRRLEPLPAAPALAGEPPPFD